MVVEEVLVASTAGVTGGDGGNVHYAAQLDATEVIEEPVVVATAGQTGGDTGNPHYQRELGQLIGQL